MNVTSPPNFGQQETKNNQKSVGPLSHNLFHSQPPK
jgi:hypothetical protein